MRLPSHQNCKGKNGLSFKLLACHGMYVIAAEQTKAPFDPKEIIFPWEVWARVGGNVVLRAERLRCWRPLLSTWRDHCAQLQG